MKYFISLILFTFSIFSCGQRHDSHGGTHDMHHGVKDESSKKVEVSPSDAFPVIGYKKVHEEIIPFPIEKVFPLFEPKGRSLLYKNWDPVVLRQGTNESLKGHIEFSKFDDLNVFLTVTKHDPENYHIQYLVVWDDFEIQRIDISCIPEEDEKSTKITWVEHNAGLYEKGVSLVGMFVEEGYLVKVVKRYINNIEKQLANEK